MTALNMIPERLLRIFPMFYLFGCHRRHNPPKKENAQAAFKVLNVLIIAAIRIWVSGSVHSTVKLTVIKKQKHWNRINFRHTLRWQDNWKFTEVQRWDSARLNERKSEAGGERRGSTNHFMHSNLLLCLSSIHLSPEGPGLIAGPGSDALPQSATPGST